MAFDFNRWIRQPTTIHALGVVAAGVGAALAHVATGNPTLDLAIAGIAYVGMHLGIDDHSAAEQSVTAAVTDLIGAAQGRMLQPVKLLTDATAAAQGIQDAAAVPAGNPPAPGAPAPQPAA